MTESLNPLLILELTEQCLAYLLGFRADLRACALVSKTWTSAAQRYLFKWIYLPANSHAENVCSRLERTLAASPDLIRHIHRLDLFQEGAFTTKWLTRMCNLPFTHLTHVVFHALCYLSGPDSRTLGKLFSLPTLCRVELKGLISWPDVFLPLWESCSPNIRHLRLQCELRRSPYDESAKPFHPTHRHSSSPISLKSLRLGRANNLDDWLIHPLCPFDFSKLAVLSISIHTSVIGWSTMASALQTIEALDFTVPSTNPEKIQTSRGLETRRQDPQPIDLSLFPDLLALRVDSIKTASMTVDTLSTIPPSSRIRHITLGLVLTHHDDDAYLPIAATLAALSLQHPLTVELETEPSKYELWAPHFRLGSRNVLRRADPNRDWVESYICGTAVFY
ncbi:hypothetical protein K438DRAFT_772519 [Mycena galopus ATCC 62051]|nr:hypothetical protein K438DRAFT_772519 [Mycena galopus ATCC 62051]